MLNVYTHTSLLTENNRKSIFPLLLGLWYKYIPEVKSYYQLVNEIQEADVLILPLNIEVMLKYHKSVYLNFLKLSEQYNKPLWIYSGGDFGTTLKIKNVYTFRLGGFNTIYNPESTFIIPSFIQDPYEHYLSNFSTNIYSTIPTIGFVGHAHHGIKKYTKELLSYIKGKCNTFFKRNNYDMQSFFPSSIVRFKFLKKLQKSKQLQTNFIFRENYRAGALNNAAYKEKTTLEYFNNIANNQYTFCIRGAGNFSVRFYETLAVGRIPIFIDTNCDLPLNFLIDWDKHICKINYKDYGSIDKIILNFHNQYSEQQIKQILESNRNLFKNDLTHENYFKHIHNFWVKNKL